MGNILFYCPYTGPRLVNRDGRFSPWDRFGQLSEVPKELRKRADQIEAQIKEAEDHENKTMIEKLEKRGFKVKRAS